MAHCIRSLTLAGILVMTQAALTWAACVAPPANNANWKAEWHDIVSINTSKDLNPGIVFVQTLDETGVGKISLDYYAVTLTPPSDAKQFFAEFRRSLADLLFSRVSSRYVYGLRAYDEGSAETWKSTTPVGALMTFILFQVRGVMEFERGSVVVSCADDTTFVFTTVHTKKDGDHPVSGNRGFGVVANADGSVTLFTKGAHRAKGSPYFNVIDQVESEAMFGAFAKVWEQLLDRLFETYHDYQSRHRTQISHREPYSPSFSPSLGDPLLPKPFPLGEAERAAFRNGIREFDAVRVLYGGSLNADVSAGLLRKTLGQTNGSLSGSTSDTLAYMAGLHFASSYTSKYAHLLSSARQQLGVSEIALITTPQLGLVVTPEVEQAGATFRRLLTVNPALMNLPEGLPDTTRVLRQSLAALSNSANRAAALRDVLRTGVQDAAYAAVTQQIEALTQQLTEAVQQQVIDFVAKDLDLDPETVEQILALRTYFSDKQALKQLELKNLKDMNHVLFKVLMISGTCLCVPPNCTTLQIACTAKFLYERFERWDPNWKELVRWGAETLASVYGFEEAIYVAELAKYTEAVQKAVALYTQFQSAWGGVQAAVEFDRAVHDLVDIDWNGSIERSIAAYVRRATGVVSSLDVTQLREFCPSTGSQSETDRDACALLDAAQRFERGSHRIASSLSIMTQELGTIEGLGAILEPLTAAANELARVATQLLRPAVERLYLEGDRLTVAPTLAHAFDVSRQLIEPFVSGMASDIATVRSAADLLAEIHEAALADATSQLAQILSESHADPAPAFSSALPQKKAAERVLTFASLTRELAELYSYPSQDIETIHQRYRESQSAFMFFRQFPPYFYKRAMLLADTEPKFSEMAGRIRRYRAWTTGDPHLQNFGSFLPLNKKAVDALNDIGPTDEFMNPNSCAQEVPLDGDARIVMNDVDDGGEGSPMLDVVRYLLGLELFMPGLVEQRLSDLLSAYRSGIAGSELVLSEPSRRLLGESIGRIVDCKLISGMSVKPKYLSPSGDKFGRIRKDVHEPLTLTSEDRAVAEALIRQFFSSKAVLLDSYKYQRLRGGSGGNWRWELLVLNRGEQLQHPGRPSVSPIPYWIEIKGLAWIPGNHPATEFRYSGGADEMIKQAKNRYRTSLIVTHGGDDALGSYRLVDTPDGPGLMRYRFAGQDFYPVSTMSADRLLAVARDQLAILGQIHRKGFMVWHGSAQPLLDEYIASLSTDSASLLAFVQELRRDLDAAYETVKQHDEALAAQLRSLPSLSPEIQDQLARLDKLIEQRQASAKPIGDQDQDEADEAPDTGVGPSFTVYEINHDPVEPDCQEQTAGWSRDDFKFVSIINLSTAPLSTEGLKFTKGVEYAFPSWEVPPQGLLVVAQNPDAVKSRYVFPPGTSILGPFEKKLAAEGERLKLVRERLSGERQESFDFDFKANWLGANARHALLNDRLLTASDDLSLETSWTAFRRQTTRPSLGQLLPEMVMYQASPPKGDKHDFVLLANTADRELVLDGAIISGGVRVPLTGKLASGKRLAIASDPAAFQARYGAVADRVLAYSGKLSNDDDDFELTCQAPAEPKRLWRVKYKATHWPATVNGGGLGLRPIDLCKPLDLRAPGSWEPVKLSEELQRSPVCPNVRLNLCDGHSFSATWTRDFVSGTAQFVCERTNEGLVARLRSMSCTAGFQKEINKATGTETCVPMTRQ